MAKKKKKRPEPRPVVQLPENGQFNYVCWGTCDVSHPECQKCLYLKPCLDTYHQPPDGYTATYEIDDLDLRIRFEVTITARNEKIYVKKSPTSVIAVIDEQDVP
jgi:hypothetical protein